MVESPLWNRTLTDISAFDISQLVENRVSEGVHLDFKESLPGETDRDKMKFKLSVCAFANGAGGDILFGVRERRNEKEKTGEAEQIVGIGTDSIDSVKTRLSHIIKEGVQPRLLVQFADVTLPVDKRVLILRCRRSWNAPHGVRFGEGYRFPIRRASGTHYLDVGELRTVFLRSEAIAGKTAAFRTDRLFRLMNGEAPMPLEGGPLIVLHVIPFGAFDLGAQSLDLQRIERKGKDKKGYMLLTDRGFVGRYNLDGYVTHTWKSDPTTASSFLQVFRQGILEYADTAMLDLRPERRIPGWVFENQVRRCLQDGLDLLQEQGMSPPVVVLVSLLGVKGFQFADESGLWASDKPPIDRESLVLPDVLIEDSSADLGAALTPVFDMIWNAAGFPESPYRHRFGVR